MDTSKNYYETFMRDFQAYGRGRTLEQYCRDEGADYKWFEKATEQYGPLDQKKAKTSKRVKKSEERPIDMIQLHFDQESEYTVSEMHDAPLSTAAGTEDSTFVGKSTWRVASLRMVTPQGHEIEISTSNPSAVSELLSKLTA